MNENNIDWSSEVDWPSKATSAEKIEKRKEGKEGGTSHPKA